MILYRAVRAALLGFCRLWFRLTIEGRIVRIADFPAGDESLALVNPRSPHSPQEPTGSWSRSIPIPRTPSATAPSR